MKKLEYTSTRTYLGTCCVGYVLRCRKAVPIWEYPRIYISLGLGAAGVYIRRMYDTNKAPIIQSWLWECDHGKDNSNV